MKRILIINDNSASAKHAATFAFNIAKKIKANVLVANLIKVSTTNKVSERVFAPANGHAESNIKPGTTALTSLPLINNTNETFTPAVHQIDATDFNEKNLVEYIVNNDIFLVVNGIADLYAWNLRFAIIDIKAVLNRIHCPVLFVPENMPLKSIERIVYMADLRYCRLPVVKSVCALAASFKADVLIAHLSAHGLPHMEESHAASLFEEAVFNKVRYSELYFNNTRERNIEQAADVLIHGMNTDMLVMVNHQFHFDELIAAYSKKRQGYIDTPLLVFPY